VVTVLSLLKPFQRDPFSLFCERHGLRWQTAYNFGFAVLNPARSSTRQRVRADSGHAEAPRREAECRQSIGG
jgi:hypothetical protein